MNIFNKLDRIPPPYSTIFALVMVSLLGLALILWREETRLLGLGFVAGGFLSIIFKAATEASAGESGDEQWQGFRKLLGGKEEEDES